MTYKQIIEKVTEACENLPTSADYSVVFDTLLYDALRKNEGPISDDTDRAERTEADPATDN